MIDLPRLNLFHNELEHDVAAKIASAEYDQALRMIAVGVSSFYTKPYVSGHTLYLSGFDGLLRQLGQLMCDDGDWAPGTARMLILSEFYANSGGHSRVAEDMVQAMGGAVVVLTDLYGRYLSGEYTTEAAAGKMPQAMVYRLQKPTLAEKVQELQTIFRAVRPASVTFIAHHPDPVPYVAATSLPRSVKKIFIHHGDHNPSLGGTLDDYRHVDFTDHLQHICSGHLQRKSLVLPLFVADRGEKIFSMPKPSAVNIVSAGTATKYKIDGPLAYHLVIAEILASLDGHYWHIGSLNDAVPELIRNTLRERGIDPARFTYLPSVPSLWDTLKEIDAHVYLVSFPTGGGRGAIEAQGCGYPVVYYAADDRPPLLAHADVYADRSLGWQSVPELIEKLQESSQNHAQRVERARGYYLQGYSQTRFNSALDEILA